MAARLLSNARRPSLSWLLVGALLLAQTLGLAHRVLHAGPPAQAASPATAHAASHEAEGVLQALFGHAQGAADCPLFDHVASSELLPSMPWSPVVLAMQEAPAAAIAPTAASVTEPVFLARAPPRRA